jgi:hypothetical protein
LETAGVEEGIEEVPIVTSDTQVDDLDADLLPAGILEPLKLFLSDFISLRFLFRDSGN